MPPDYRYVDFEVAKKEAVDALRDHLIRALTKID
jgi:hypothetical protein